MASATATRGGSKKQAEEQVSVSPPSRREFLYYIWGASMLLLLGQAGAGILWFAYPRFQEGTFGGVFRFDPARVPPPGGPVESEPSGRFHVANTEASALVTLYAVCTHLGCLPPWTRQTDRFECPCHGSKFARDGSYIEGPAPRAMDRFVTTITFEDGTSETTGEDGAPIPLQGRRIASIAIDTGEIIRGENN